MISNLIIQRCSAQYTCTITIVTEIKPGRKRRRWQLQCISPIYIICGYQITVNLILNCCCVCFTGEYRCIIGVGYCNCKTLYRICSRSICYSQHYSMITYIRIFRYAFQSTCTITIVHQLEPARNGGCSNNQLISFIYITWNDWITVQTILSGCCISCTGKYWSIIYRTYKYIHIRCIVTLILTIIRSQGQNNWIRWKIVFH